jgi:DNA-binding response OmpR family regulator
MPSTTILVIEDDPDIVELLQYNLERDGFGVLTARDGETGVQEASKRRPSLILLDLMLPGQDGLEVCRLLKQSAATSSIPIIMLTAKNEEEDVVVGLRMGADDYVTKPFRPRELLARVRAVLRRGAARPAGSGKAAIQYGNLTIDPDGHEVRIGKQALSLTASEFRLLLALASRPGRVFTRDQLLDHVTGGEGVVVDRNVDVHISSLRKKLGASRRHIVTVRGVGYKWAG